MSTSRVATLSPVDVSVVITQSSTGLVHVVGGYMDDSNITVERGSDSYEKHNGVDNKTSRIYKADKSGMITVNLAHTSVVTMYLMPCSVMMQQRATALACSPSLSKTGVAVQSTSLRKHGFQKSLIVLSALVCKRVSG